MHYLHSKGGQPAAFAVSTQDSDCRAVLLVTSHNGQG